MILNSLTFVKPEKYVISQNSIQERQTRKIRNAGEGGGGAVAILYKAVSLERAKKASIHFLVRKYVTYKGKRVTTPLKKATEKAVSSGKLPRFT